MHIRCVWESRTHPISVCILFFKNVNCLGGKNVPKGTNTGKRLKDAYDQAAGAPARGEKAHPDGLQGWHRIESAFKIVQRNVVDKRDPIAIPEIEVCFRW